MSKTLSSLLLLIAAVPLALAHPGHGATGFQAGLVHPLVGFDHLLAMVAVGILGVRCGGRALWLVPLSFMACMVVGGLAAWAGLPLPLAEWGIALSVLVFGAMIAFAAPPRAWIACAVVGTFALMHGHAHVAEMTGDQGLTAFVSGFLIATGALHAAGIGLATVAMRTAPTAVLRGMGGAIAMASVVLFAQLA